MSVLGLLLTVIIAITVFDNNLPHNGSVDMDASKIRCANGKSFSYSEAGLELFSATSLNETLDIWMDSDKTKAYNLCRTITKPKGRILAVEEFLSGDFKKEPSFILVGSTKEALVKAIKCFALLLTGIYLLRETALYLFFNKSFDLSCLICVSRSLITFCTSSE